MKFNTTIFCSRILPIIAAGCISLPVHAQQSQSENRNSANRQGSGQKQDAETEEKKSQSSRQSSQSGQSDRAGSSSQDRSKAQIRVQPEGWVRMGIDYNNDGTYDVIETVYVYDLQMAQQRSRDRRQQGQSQNQSQRRSDSQMQDGQSQSDRQQTAQKRGKSSATSSVTGEVQDVRKIEMRDGGDQFVIARVRTEEGRTAKVLLGKQKQISKLDLQDGDKIQVDGRRGRVNDQWVLVANSIKADGKTTKVEVDRMEKPIRQFKGEVVRTRTARFKGHDGEFLTAQMQGKDGNQRVVNLGPKDKFADLDLKQADEVCVLASAGKINQQDALIAEEVSVDGETIQVKPDQRREQRWSSKENSSSQKSYQRSSQR